MADSLNGVRHFIVAAVLSLLSTGCAGTHLYNADDHKAAQDAVAALTAASPDKVFQASRANLAILAARQEAQARDVVLAGRKLDFYGLTKDGKVDGAKVKSHIDTLLSRLLGSSDEQAVDAVGMVKGRLSRQSTLRDTLDGRAASFAGTGVRVPPCVAEKALPAFADFKHDDPTGDLAALYQSYTQECGRVLAAEAQGEDWPSLAGTLGAASVAANDARARLAGLDLAAAAAKKTADAAAAALKQAAEAVAQAAEVKLPALQKDLSEKAEAAAKAVDGLAGSGLIGEEEAARQRLAHIDAILTALADNTAATDKPASTEQVAVAYLKSLGTVSEGIGRLQAKARMPALTPLILERDRQKYLLLAAQLAQAAAHKRLTYLDDQVAALLDEAVLLKRAREEADAGKQDAALHSLALAYSDAMARAEVARVRVLIHDETAVLAQDENAIGAWYTLAQVPVKQLEAFHASGVKPEEIGGLASQVVLLGAIAWGVNK